MVLRPYDPALAAAWHRRKVAAIGLAGLAAVLAWQAVMLSRWMAKDTRPSSWDQSIHLESALDMRDALRARHWSQAFHPVPKPGMPAFPPLYHLALQPAVGAADPEHAALWVNFAYFALLTVCLFGLIFEFRPDLTAAAATAAFVCAPGVQDLLYTQLVDLPVLACSVAAFWAFLRSEGFTLWVPSLAFGVLYAAGMLHKWSFFSYMIPAYVAALQLLSSRIKPRGPLLASAAVALVLFVPWYAANWPLMLPRLVQASSDFAIPVWQGAAFFTYLAQSFQGLGPGLWLMGWLGLLVPRYRRNDHNGSLIALWIASSYLFWAIVPNRQLRFLLPGLPGLAVLACGSWPTPMVWGLLALQLFGAANFMAGWLGPFRIPTPIGTAALFPNEPPQAANWQVDAVLREAERLRDPQEPLANITLIANDHYFNGPTFTWRRRALGLERLRVRGVNRRLCEFSQFVVLKTGTLGPDNVIGGLPEAAAIVSKSRWFSHAFDKAGQWPLPDGSNAVLYRRSKAGRVPFNGWGPVKFEEYSSGSFTAEDLVINLGGWDAASGVYPSASLSARRVELRGLTLTGVRMQMQGLLAVPAADPPHDQWEDIRFMKLRALKLASVRVEASSLKSFLEQRVKGLSVSSVKIDRTLKVAGSFKGLPVTLELALDLQRQPRALRIKIVSLKLGPNPLPVGAINRVKELTVSLEPNSETPFAIDLPSLTLRNDALTIP